MPRLPPSVAVLFLPLLTHVSSLLKFRVSYDIPKMEDGLLDLERKHQGHGKRIVKITIPPTGVVAVTRSTGSVIPFELLLALTKLYRQTVYLTELSLPPPRNDLQAAPDDTLAMPEGEPRTSGAKDRGGPQHNMRDTIVPKSATTEMPNPSPLRVSSYSVRHHGLLNSDGGCEHQTWEGRYTVGGSRQTLSTPTSSDANTEEGPTGPPKPPSSPPLPSPRLFSWSDACIQARLHPYEVDMLSRSYPAISSTARPKIRGSSNYQTYPYWQGHSLQYPPHISHQVTHNQGLLLPGIGCGGSDPMLQALICWHTNIQHQTTTLSRGRSIYHRLCNQPLPLTRLSSMTLLGSDSALTARSGTQTLRNLTDQMGNPFS